MKCNQSRPGFELESPCSFPTTITTTPRVRLGLFVIGTVTKVLAKELEDIEIRGRVKTIKTRALLRSVRILSRVLET